MNEVDWVTARFECTIDKLWERLARRLAEDVKVWNVKADTERRPHVVIEDEHKAAGLLTIFSPAGAGARRSVKIHRRSGDLFITADDMEGVPLTPILNDKGECRLLQNNKELELWQASRLILEPLLFRE